RRKCEAFLHQSPAEILLLGLSWRRNKHDPLTQRVHVHHCTVTTARNDQRRSINLRLQCIGCEKIHDATVARRCFFRREAAHDEISQARLRQLGYNNVLEQGALRLRTRQDENNISLYRRRRCGRTKAGQHAHVKYRWSYTRVSKRNKFTRNGCAALLIRNPDTVKLINVL